MLVFSIIIYLNNKYYNNRVFFYTYAVKNGPFLQKFGRHTLTQLGLQKSPEIGIHHGVCMFFSAIIAISILQMRRHQSIQ